MLVVMVPVYPAHEAILSSTYVVEIPKQDYMCDRKFLFSLRIQYMPHFICK